MNHGIYFKRLLRKLGTAEVVQWLRTFTDLSKDLKSAPINHMVTQNHLELQFVEMKLPFSAFNGHQACTWYIDTHEAKILLSRMYINSRAEKRKKVNCMV